MPIGPDESMSESTVRYFKILQGLGGMIVAKNGDPDVRGGNVPRRQSQTASKTGQVNSTGSPKGYSEGRIGC